MTAKDEVAGLPGGSGAGLAAQADKVYNAHPDSIQTLITAISKAVTDAEGADRTLDTAVANLGAEWSGGAGDGFKGYMTRFGAAGDAARGAMSQGVTGLTTAMNALVNGKPVVESAFEAILTHYRQLVKNAPDITDQERASAASTAVGDGTARVTEAIHGIETELGNAATALRNALGAVNPKFSAMSAPDGSVFQPKDAPAKQDGGQHSGGGGGGGGTGGGGGGGLGPSGGPPGGGGPAPTGQVKDWIQEALRILQENGVDTSKISESDLWAIIQHESGGNPNAINLWDSNYKAGHPSKGLMQCIDSTFNSHKLPGHDNIYSPVDNIIAGVRYSISRYGGVSNVPGIRAMNSGSGYVGY